MSHDVRSGSDSGCPFWRSLASWLTTDISEIQVDTNHRTRTAGC
jgi:hypothetical protein